MRRLTTGRNVLLALVAALAAIAGVIAEQAFADNHDTGANRVRIVARLLEDTRIEFALLQGRLVDVDASLDWSSAPILPRQRYFPASPRDDRWLYASPQTITTGGGAEYTVRITARRLANGRTEFGLQMRQGSDWSATHLPPSRFFPADAAPGGGWLRSSEINLDEVFNAVPDGVPVITSSDGVVLRIGDLDGNRWTSPEPTLYYGAARDALTDELRTWVVARARTDHSLWDTVRLQVGCYGGVYFVSMWEDILPDAGSDRVVSVRYRIDDGAAVEDAWRASDESDDDFVASDGFGRALRGANELLVRLSFDSITLTATFTGLRELWATPVQPNLDYCGRY